MKVQRDNYSLQVFADLAGMEVADVLHLGAQAHAQICASVSGMVEGIKLLEISRPAHETSDAYPWLQASLMPDGILELEPAFLRFCERELACGLPIELSGGLLSDGDRWFKVELTPPVAIELRHFCILHSEAVRLMPEQFDVQTPALGLPAGAHWPWGGHTTELLEKLAKAAKKFWSLYDPTDPTSAPTNERVADFLRELGVADRTAVVMATILRADGLPTGPRKGPRQ